VRCDPYVRRQTVKIRSVIANKPYRKPFKEEAQTVLFKDPVRTAQ